MAKPQKRVALAGSERARVPGARDVGPASPGERITVSVLLRPKKPFMPSSPEFSRALPGERHYLSREEFAEAFGADPEDVRKVERFAQEHNLTIITINLARRTVVLGGTLAQLCEAFGTQLSSFEHEGRVFRGRTGPLFVPKALHGIVQGVFGLDNRRQARPRFPLGRPTLRPLAEAAIVYTPLQVAALYNFPPGTDGTGQALGILEFGGGYTPSDLQTYFSQVGVAVPSVTAVSVDGVQNQPAPGTDSPDGEVELDIEVAGAVAPGASIVVYFSDFTEQGWVDAVTTAIHDSVHRPSVISISWGFPEGQDIWTAQAMQAVSQAFQSAAAMGITVYVASGDDGSRDEVNDGLAHVDFPASSPYVVACGGTTLNSTNGAISSEVVWNNGPNGGASGGGVSAQFPLPAWQSGAGVPLSVNPGHNAGRGVPDIAGNADPETGYQIYVDGQSYVAGGTSAVAPLWAALTARMNQKLPNPAGFLNPLIYPPAVSSSAAFRDTTSGNNDITGQIGGYSAGVGWDACTGWGSPNGSALLAALQGSASAGVRASARPETRRKTAKPAAARARQKSRRARLRPR